MLPDMFFAAVGFLVRRIYQCQQSWLAWVDVRLCLSVCLFVCLSVCLQHGFGVKKSKVKDTGSIHAFFTL